MQRTARQVLCVTVLAGMAAACASTPPPSMTGAGARSAGGTYKVGKPYQIGDTWYYPHEQPDYDQVGVASWYGPTFYGKQTANGELFDGNGLTAAHPTLPMPVNVRVTNLDNGKSVVVRVNDRGPYAQGRIIDVSKRAAELLGFYARGTARVRVTYLGRADSPNGSPPDAAREIARALPAAPVGRVQAAPLSTGAPPPPVRVASLAPPPGVPSGIEAEPAPSGQDSEANESDDASVSQDTSDDVANVNASAETRQLYVQAGAFASRENADRLKAQLSDADGLFISQAEHDGKPLYRVRSGPYDDLEAANAALARLTGLGNNDARIVIDP
jgi:rare lipoprotein A